jgi:hypothetical protein
LPDNGVGSLGDMRPLDGPDADAPMDLPTSKRDWGPDEADGGVHDGPRDGGVHDGPRDGGVHDGPRDGGVRDGSVHDGSAKDQGADKRRDGNPG